MRTFLHDRLFRPLRVSRKRHVVAFSDGAFDEETGRGGSVAVFARPRDGKLLRLVGVCHKDKTQLETEISGIQLVARGTARWPRIRARSDSAIAVRGINNAKNYHKTGEMIYLDTGVPIVRPPAFWEDYCAIDEEIRHNDASVEFVAVLRDFVTCADMAADNLTSVEFGEPTIGKMVPSHKWGEFIGMLHADMASV